MMRLGIGMLVSLMSIAGADAQPVDSRVTVAVMRDGRVEVNGQTVDNVAASLQRAGDGSLIVYYREAGDSEPTERQIAAFLAIMETAEAKGMSIKLSATPDFATTVDDQGRVVPQ